MSLESWEKKGKDVGGKPDHTPRVKTGLCPL